MPLGSEVDELSSIDEEEFRMSRVWTGKWWQMWVNSEWQNEFEYNDDDDMVRWLVDGEKKSITSRKERHWRGTRRNVDERGGRLDSLFLQNVYRLIIVYSVDWWSNKVEVEFIVTTPLEVLQEVETTLLMEEWYIRGNSSVKLDMVPKWFHRWGKRLSKVRDVRLSLWKSILWLGSRYVTLFCMHRPSCCQLAAGLERLSLSSFRRFLQLNPRFGSVMSER